jgi:predicted dehydrogenase
MLSCRAMTDRTIRVGFVGAGANSRKHHIPKLKAQPGVELAAVANRSKESGDRIAGEFGIARVYADWRELVRAPDIDAVCIGTWPNTHSEITRAVLEHGKHVLCEARMAMNAAEARTMLDAARRAPHFVTQLVPAPNTLEVDSTLQALLAEGYVGDVLAVEVQANQGQFVDAEAPLHWRQDAALSGLNVMTMGIWYEALMRWLGPARRVMALTKIAVPRRKDGAGAWRDVRVPDHVEILATLGRGASAHMCFSTVTALAPPSEVWIFGTEGTLRVESDAKRVSGGRRGDKALREIPIPAERRIGWRVEEEFVNAIRGREKVTRTTFEDGVRYMEFTEAVWKSAQSGQAADVAEL